MIRRLLLSCWYTAAALVVLVAVLLSAARLFLPYAEDYRQEIAARVSDALELNVELQGMDLAWRGLGPEVRFEGVRLLEPHTGKPLLSARELRVGLDLWRSAVEGQLVPAVISVLGTNLSLVRGLDGRIVLDGFRQPSMMENPLEVLLQQPRFELLGVSLMWRDERYPERRWFVEKADVRLRSRGDRHQLNLWAVLPPALGRTLELGADLHGPISNTMAWSGLLYARGADINAESWLGTHLRDWLGEQPQVSGRVDAEVWARLVIGQPQSVRARFSMRELRVGSRTPVRPELALERLAGDIEWQRAGDAWSLQVASLDARGDAGDWATSGLALQARPLSGGQTAVELVADTCDLDLVSRLAPFAPRIDAQALAWIEGLRPSGRLQDLVFRVTRVGDQWSGPRLQAVFSGLGFQPYHKLPGMRGLSGRIAGTDQAGVLSLETREAIWRAPDWFRAPLAVDLLQGNLSWQLLSDRLHVTGSNLYLAAPGLRTRTRLHLDLPRDGTAPFFDLQASVLDGDVGQVSRYLPARVMKPKAVAWLDRGLIAGTVTSGGLLIHGRLSDFPFEHAEGRFEARLNVSDAVLDYRAEWPRIEELETEIAFINRTMRIRGVSGKILESEIRDVDVGIEDLRHPLLTVQGVAEGDLAGMLRFVHESPLGTRQARVLGPMTGSGDAHLDLGLDIPLHGKRRQVRVRGDLKLDGNRLQLAEWKLALAELGGQVHFTEREIRAPDLRARLFGAPVRMAIQPGGAGPKVATRVTVRGRPPLLKHFGMTDGPLFGHLRGRPRWSIELALPPSDPAEPLPIGLVVASDLKGLEVDLPPPLGKPADAVRALRLSTDLQRGQYGPLQFVYGDDLAGRVDISGANGGAVRAVVRVGGGMPGALPETGIRLEGELVALDLQPWIDHFRHQAALTTRASELRGEVDLHVGEVSVLGRRFRDVSVQASAGPTGIDLRLDGPDCEGQANIPASSGAPVEVRLALLSIGEGDVQEQTELSAEVEPARLPPLDIAIEQLNFEGLALGEVAIKTRPAMEGLNVESLSVASDWMTLSANGSWHRGPGGHLSRFVVILDAPDFGRLLRRLGYAAQIEGGETHVELDANWRGTPMQFQPARVEGTLVLNVGKGRLTSVNPGAGRVFGLLNLHALPRRLSLDFSDFFQAGFAFDRIHGRFTLVDGDAYTNDLYVDGPAARIEITGRAGLAARDYDQLVTVIPRVRSPGLAIAGTLAGGPVVGAAVYLADQIILSQIDELSRLTQYQYTLRGSWEDPVVRRLPRKSLPTASDGADGDEE